MIFYQKKQQNPMYAKFLSCMEEFIFTEEDYRKAIIRFLEICDSEPGTPEHDEATQLSKLMEKYESVSFYERQKYN